jgi:adenylate kinase family enzyme
MDRGSVRPTVAELVGPPGSGKTTLLRALPSRDGIVAISRLRRQGHLDLYLRSGFALVPMLKEINSVSTGRWARWDHLIRLRASLALVERCAQRRVPLLVFDQGPTFTLTWLQARMRSSETSNGLEGWLERSVARWADRLDFVLLLDAPDDVLLQRIRSRSKSHVLKDLEDEAIRGEIARFRETFESVIARLGDLGGQQVLRFDTSRRPVGEVARVVEHLLRAGASRREGGPAAASDLPGSGA